MSTPNFSVKNASLVYAIEISDDEDFDMIDEGIKEGLQELGFETDIEDEWDNNRNYGGKILGKKQVWTKNKKNYGYSYILKAIIRDGYYSGVNLDWGLSFEGEDGCITEELDWKDIKNDYEWLGIKITNTIAKAIEEKVKNISDKDIKKLERFYAKMSTPLRCMGIFSNGEAIYEKAKK